MIPSWSAPSSSSSLGEDHPVGRSRREASRARARRPSGQNARRAARRHRRAGAEVPRAADDLARLALADVDLAELEPVGVRMLPRLEHAADAEEAEVAVDVGDAAADDPLDLAASRRRAASRARRAARRRRRSRAARRGGPSSAVHLELPQEAQVVLPEHADVGEPWRSIGDPLEPEPEGEARSTPRGRSRRTAKTAGSTMPAPPDLDPAGVLADAAARCRRRGSR